MSRVLRELGCEVTGVEIDAKAGEIAAAYCKRMVIGDLDHLGLDFGGERFDVVVAADVLEHLKDPLRILQRVRQLLEPDGHLVVSIPNIAHLSVRLALMAGTFPYADTGLLDSTHLRFFTRRSLEVLIEEAGFAIGLLHRITSIPPDPANFEVPYDPASVPATLLESLSRDPEASTYQFVVKAFPLPVSGLTYIQDRMKQLAGEVELAQGEMARLKATVEENTRQAEAQRDELLERCGREEREKQALVTNCQALQAENEGLQQQIDSFGKDNEFLRQGLAGKEREISELMALHETSKADAAEIRASLTAEQERAAGLEERAAGLEAQVAILSERERDLREMLLDAHDQLLRRDEEIAAALTPAQMQTAAVPPSASVPSYPVSPRQVHYQGMLQRVRETVARIVPQGSRVLVISKGDAELLRLEGCHGMHFPQRDDGVYAGYYPADGRAAIAHLDELRTRGARFLVIPETARWWLTHYTEFAEYLARQFNQVTDLPDTCIVFDLSTRAEEGSTGEPAVDRTPAVPAGSPEVLPFGVNLSGHFASEKGVGEGVRGTLRSLQSAGIPVVLNNFCDEHSVNPCENTGDFHESNPYAINLIHLNADAAPLFVELRGQEYLNGRYNLGYWAWELSSFPDEWRSSFSYFNEIWAPSTFVLDSVARSSPIPVIAIPHSIPETLQTSDEYGRGAIGIDRDTFVFFFMFDFMSVVERKNPLGLIKAFQSAFGRQSDVLLLIKVVHNKTYPEKYRELESAAKAPNIRILNRVLKKEETNSLLRACDCYVSLHRSEGFGITIAEAMNCEKPVIATAYSGNMDFMTPANSFLVKYRLSEMERDYSPYRKGCVWADPDLDDAAQLMRYVYEQRAAASEVGRQARKDIVRTLRPTAVGKLISERFQKLAAMGRIRMLAELAAAGSCI
jgi:glycosyltransferase involved in cell wall biosynthesis